MSPSQNRKNPPTRGKMHLRKPRHNASDTVNSTHIETFKKYCHFLLRLISEGILYHFVNVPDSSLYSFELSVVVVDVGYTVASLGWVTPGAANEGVTPLFFPENLATFFAHRCHYHYRFSLLSLGCHHLQGITPHLFYLFDLVSPLFFVNLPTQFFPFGCHPLEGVTRGGPPPPLWRHWLYRSVRVIA